MDDQTKKMLLELISTTQENNKYLKKIDRRQRYHMYWRIFVLIIAVTSALGIYYYALPYLGQLMDFYNQIENTFIQFNTLPDQFRGLVTPKNS
jgi:hypothetical protein